jgi:indole-3-glycerol phosphate synthase
MSVLQEIVARKRARLNHSKGKVSLGDLKGRIAGLEAPRDFRSAVKREGSRIRLIAEIKRASPSRGIMRGDFDLKGIARIYEEKNVDAVSVLTEEDSFLGDLNHIVTVKQIVSRPVLRKDFIFDGYQIYESRAYSADAILIIASLVERTQAEEYLHLSRELGLSVLFEVHNLREIEKALRVNAGIIGINNRDLKTLKVDLSTTLRIKREIPHDRIVVSESGIRTRDEAVRLQDAGIDAMLIGTSIMESQDIGKKIEELTGCVAA